MSDEHMWLIPFTDGQDHLLTIDLGHTTPLVGFRVWNYNKSTDDSFRGVCISLTNEFDEICYVHSNFWKASGATFAQRHAAGTGIQMIRVSLYQVFFLYHEVRDCYFVSLLMLIFIVHRPNKFTLSSMIGIFHHLRDFSWEKVNRLSNMEHISTIFIDVLSSNIFIF